MLIYHGSPFSDAKIAAEVYRGRCAMVSFAHPDQLELIAEVASLFALDNGAFTAWRGGEPVTDWALFYAWVEKWKNHPSCNLVLIPDVIDGGEADNDELIAEWPFSDCGVPIWHLHESLDRLDRLANSFAHVALGSSGKYRTPGSLLWWDRMCHVMRLLCDDDGFPRVKLHGLRMLAPDILANFPFHSGDACTAARNVNLDVNWDGPCKPLTKLGRALALVERMESAPVAKRWTGPVERPDVEQMPLWEAIAC